MARGLLVDPDLASVRAAVHEAFRLASRDEATLVVAYVGHAVERDGELYVLPVDAGAQPNDDTGVNFGRLFAQDLADHPGVDGVIVLLDGCTSGVGRVNAGQGWLRPAANAGRRFEVVSAAGFDPGPGRAAQPCAHRAHPRRGHAVRADDQVLRRPARRR